jgi:uncharacterized RDD family membrane protein YckC
VEERTEGLSRSRERGSEPCAGRTPSEIHVCRAADGDLIGPSAALLRFAGLILAALPLFAGFLTILVDDRRRGVHDMLAGTVVVPAPPEPSG